ncbi:small acid-soluble spore protein SspI [Paenibacillus sp. SN-8-1]|uniref:small acid-soluble spore protein SspI n=1 Tax=Paenibacillus sp. SN-8-1 TaxID=3435409 RepID=UPI003D9A5304
MGIMLDLRQAVIHKVHGQDNQGLRSMIEGSVDGPEAALPGLGVMFEMMWKQLDRTKQDELIGIVSQQLKTAELKPLL